MCRSDISKTQKPKFRETEIIQTMNIFEPHGQDEIPLLPLPGMPLVSIMNDWARSRIIYPADSSTVIIYERHDHVQAAISMGRCLPRSLLIRIYHVFYKSYIKIPVSELVDVINSCCYLRIQDEQRYSFFFNMASLP